jgi:alpha-L-fucosidase 2
VRVGTDLDLRAGRRLRRTFTVSAQQRGGAVEYVVVGSDKGNRFTLASPWGAKAVTIVDGAGSSVAHTTAGDQVSFATTAGHVYRITAQ